MSPWRLVVRQVDMGGIPTSEITKASITADGSVHRQGRAFKVLAISGPWVLLTARSSVSPVLVQSQDHPGACKQLSSVAPLGM